MQYVLLRRENAKRVAGDRDIWVVRAKLRRRLRLWGMGMLRRRAMPAMIINRLDLWEPSVSWATSTVAILPFVWVSENAHHPEL